LCFFFFGNVKGVKDESGKKKTCVSKRERERRPRVGTRSARREMVIWAHNRTKKKQTPTNKYRQSEYTTQRGRKRKRERRRDAKDIFVLLALYI